MKILQKLNSAFLSILLLPESVMTFISGIFLSAAINIATGMINENGVSLLPTHIIISMGAMFVVCIGYMILAVLVKPIQEKYKKVDKKMRDAIEKEGVSSWYQTIEDHKKKLLIILPTILLLTLLASIFSVLIIFSPYIFYTTQTNINTPLPQPIESI